VAAYLLAGFSILQQGTISAMSMLAASRVPLREIALRRAPIQARFAHGHGEYKHLPFEYKNKGAFGAKVAAYLLAGFSIPFLAAKYQIAKAGGSA